MTNRDLMAEDRLATEPKRPDATLGELFGEMTAETGRLFRKEVELAKVEGKEELRRATAAGVMFAEAAMAAWLFLLFASFALAWLLNRSLDLDVSFIIVAGIWLVLAVILLAVARNRVKRIEPLPVTTQTLKEDVTWARAQKS